MKNKTYGYQHLSQWAVIISLALAGVSLASDEIPQIMEEDGFVNRMLADGYNLDFQDFTEDAIRHYKPFSQIEDDLRGKPIDVRLNREALQILAKNKWSTAEAETHHPLLVSVCISKQGYDHSTQEGALDYRKRITNQLLLAARGYKASTRENLKILMMAAYEACQIDRITASFGFSWPKEEAKALDLSTMMYLPVELWRRIADHPFIRTESARDLWDLFPRRRLMHGYEEGDLHWTILDNICDRIKAPAYYHGDTDNESDDAWDKEQKSRSIMQSLFKVHALRRANNFAAWHLRAAFRLTKQIDDQVVYLAPFMDSQENELKERFAISGAFSQCLADLIPAINDPFVKAQAAHMAAELRAWPHRFLKTGDLGKPVIETILIEAAQKIWRNELRYAAPFLQEMQETVIEQAEGLNLQWASRLMVVRAYYGLAMLEADKAKKASLLEQALELSKLQPGEYDPTHHLLSSHISAGDYRYNHGDLYVGLDFPTWEEALKFRLKELDESEEKK